MPRLTGTHDETKRSAQMNLLDRLVGGLGPLVATRQGCFIARLGLCADLRKHQRRFALRLTC
jgi:hypothetical protein